MREYRERLGLSQEEVARRLGVSVMTDRRWEKGELPKQWRQLIILAELFGVRPEDILKGNVGH